MFVDDAAGATGSPDTYLEEVPKNSGAPSGAGGKNQKGNKGNTLKRGKGDGKNGKGKGGQDSNVRYCPEPEFAASHGKRLGNAATAANCSGCHTPKAAGPAK